MMLWRWHDPVEALSSAPVGGGRSQLDVLLNVGVELDYRRTDLAEHAEQIARGCGASTSRLTALFTAADLDRHQRAIEDRVAVDATVGITKPTWAAGEDGTFTQWKPGTINIVVQCPDRLSEAAAVNLVMTVTEAKSQALLDSGIPGTGTASDAVVVTWPAFAPVEVFGGPRSAVGAPAARAVHRAVLAGVEAYRSGLDE